MNFIVIITIAVLIWEKKNFILVSPKDNKCQTAQCMVMSVSVKYFFEEFYSTLVICQTSKTCQFPDNSFVSG